VTAVAYRRLLAYAYQIVAFITRNKTRRISDGRKKEQKGETETETERGGGEGERERERERKREAQMNLMREGGRPVKTDNARMELRLVLISIQAVFKIVMGCSVHFKHVN